MKVLKNNSIRKKIIPAVCSSVSENAIQEVIKRPELKNALRQERVSEEMRIVEQLLAEISKAGLVAYGTKDVGEAAYAGAVETIIVSDTLIRRLREAGDYASLESMLLLVERAKGNVVIVSSEHDGGRKLDGLGGIGALLRYKLSY